VTACASRRRHPVVSGDVVSQLREIAQQSAQAAEAGGSEATLLRTYPSLRTRADTLARGHGWTTSEELADLFPSPRSLREIERLDLAFEADSVPALARNRGMSARLSEALNELSACATGVRLAYETLEDDAGSGA
jgi:hypothetical protein